LERTICSASAPVRIVRFARRRAGRRYGVRSALALTAPLIDERERDARLLSGVLRVICSEPGTLRRFEPVGRERVRVALARDGEWAAPAVVGIDDARLGPLRALEVGETAS